VGLCHRETFNVLGLVLCTQPRSDLNLRIAGRAILGQMEDMKALVLIVPGLLAFGNWEAKSADKVDFAKDIQPIFKKSA
jgi:hypothetical protein